MCGEQVKVSVYERDGGGSPPRVRGTVFSLAFSHAPYRITPACAGNSAYMSVIIPLFWDHPRVCGEQARVFQFLIAVSGSPPRVRGTVNIRILSERTSRITPACAGNSLA